MQQYNISFYFPPSFGVAIVLFPTSLYLIYMAYYFWSKRKTGATMVYITRSFYLGFIQLLGGYKTENEVNNLFHDNNGFTFLSPFKLTFFASMFFFASIFAFIFMFISLDPL